MKLFPFVPGHFSGWEWLALLLWIILGVLVWRPTDSWHKATG
jgi:hypothetical protein